MKQYLVVISFSCGLKKAPVQLHLQI